MSLTGPQRRRLRAIAHHLDAVVLVGGDRMSEGLIAEVERALEDHELVKIKLIDGEKDEVKEARSVLCEHTGAEWVQTIGHQLVLWRRNAIALRVERLPDETLGKRPEPRKRRRR